MLVQLRKNYNKHYKKKNCKNLKLISCLMKYKNYRIKICTLKFLINLNLDIYVKVYSS